MTTPTTPPPHRISPEQLTRLREILYAAPELNMANYDHEQVRLLNDAVIEAFLLVDGLCQPEAPTAHPDLPTTECLQGQPGDTCQHAFCQSVPTARPEQAKSGYAWEQWSDQVAPKISLEGAVTQPAPTAAETQARIIQLMDDARKHPAYEEQGREMAAGTGTPVTDGAEFFVANTTRLSPGEGEMHVPSSVSRYLERKLAAAQAEKNEVLKLHDQICEDLAKAHAETLAKLEAIGEAVRPNRSLSDYDDTETITRVYAKLTAAEQQVAELTRELAAAHGAKTSLYMDIEAAVGRGRITSQELIAYILQDQSDLATARRDTVRLDWLEKQPTVWINMKGEHALEPEIATGSIYRTNVRAAIDAALHPSDAK